MMTKQKIIFFLLFGAAVLGALIYDAFIYEPQTIKIVTYEIDDEKLRGLRMVFASDLHLAPSDTDKKRLQRIINEINAQNPNMVIWGGDYVNGHTRSTAMSPTEIVRAMQQIKAPQVAVFGNHDSYYGKKDILAAFAQGNIPVLENRFIVSDISGRQVTFAGVSDYYTAAPDIKSALQRAPEPRIFITHSPDVFPNLQTKVNLALAGHTHGGQVVFPLIGALLVPSDFGQRYRYGLRQENGNSLIISGGLGTSLLPLRFNCAPEIVVVEFK